MFVYAILYVYACICTWVCVSEMSVCACFTMHCAHANRENLKSRKEPHGCNM